MATILLLNGPNLNRLGTREPERYGNTTLVDIVAQLQSHCQSTSSTLEHLQTNAEHELIERIHAAADAGVDGIVINPAAWTHTSIALRDALLASAIPFVEVHISNIHAREPFRQHSYFSDIAIGSIIGVGALGYELALFALFHHLGIKRVLTLPSA
ncbi:MAG: type II 3-dehydroquinate dehydratase [Halothiobacillus sp.]